MSNLQTNLKENLENLISIQSPTGYHRDINVFLKSFFEGNEIPYTETVKGSFLVTFKGTNDSDAILFSGHVDTLGAMVKKIKPSGSLEFTLLGGYMYNTLESENCMVRTSTGKKISGTVQTTMPSVHIDGNKARELKREQTTMEVILDERVSSKEDVLNLGIDIGDFIFIDPKLKALDNGFIKSRYLDDKASVSVLLEIMKNLKGKTLNNTIHFFISNYEEVGHGAKAAIPTNTKEFIAVDMGAPGNNQNSSEFKVNICVKDSSGPYDFDIKEKMIKICKDNDIPFAVDIYPHYGSDASAALNAGYDIKSGLIGPGVFASHGYERTHMDSIVATYNLIYNYILL
ncbi:MAG: M42 family metallopeptidase [Clostridium sp.]|nr:M42 family metallopeptidase [Clostridium sp.]